MANTKLKRSLTLPLLTLYGLGTILGAGVYVLVGKVAGNAGIYAPIAFLVAAIIAGFTGLSYAELSARYPRSAGEVLYVYKAFSSAQLSRLVGWLVIATGVVSSATMVNGFIGYLAVFIPLPSLLSIFLVVAIITALACWGITESVTVAAIITGIEIIGLVVVIAALGENFNTLPQRLPELTPPLEAGPWMGIMLGAFLAFYAFIGFEDMVNVAEEVIEPARTLPRAIVISLTAASLLYIIIAVLAVLSLPIAELSASDAPMVSLLEAKSELLASIVGGISLIAILNGALVQVIMGARLLYGMAAQNLAPSLFGRIAETTQTPVYASITIGIIIYLLAIAFPLTTLAKITSFIIISVFALVNFALLNILRRERPTTTISVTKFALPAIGGLLCLALLALQIYGLLSPQF